MPFMKLENLMLNDKDEIFKVVRDRKQAIAIALSEARQNGE